MKKKKNILQKKEEKENINEKIGNKNNVEKVICL